jgi:hypothetical protein
MPPEAVRKGDRLMRRPWEVAPGQGLNRAVARHIFGITDLSIDGTPPYSRDLTAALLVIPKLKRDVAEQRRPMEVLWRLEAELRDTRFWGPNDALAAEALCRAALWAVDNSSRSNQPLAFVAG